MSIISSRLTSGAAMIFLLFRSQRKITNVMASPIGLIYVLTAACLELDEFRSAEIKPVRDVIKFVVCALGVTEFGTCSRSHSDGPCATYELSSQSLRYLLVRAISSFCGYKSLMSHFAVH